MNFRTTKIMRDINCSSCNVVVKAGKNFVNLSEDGHSLGRECIKCYRIRKDRAKLLRKVYRKRPVD